MFKMLGYTVGLPVKFEECHSLSGTGSKKTMARKELTIQVEIYNMLHQENIHVQHV